MHLDAPRINGIASFPDKSRCDAPIDERHRAMSARLQTLRQFAHSRPIAALHAANVQQQ
jgi:hypothetical protein